LSIEVGEENKLLMCVFSSPKEWKRI